ncbi:MAG TPA: DUF1499 domain-containing protein [Pseudomonadales bacterium]|nr:DUF1499 domain-containing protein [Pseudomonadales bacterium]
MKITHRLQKKAAFAIKTSVVAASVLLASCAGTPSFIGVRDGDLKPCPSSPNCVSTSEVNSHGVPAFKLVMPPEQAINAIANELRKQSRVTIAVQEPRYLHAEYRSAVFRFVDDVEFYAQDDGNLAVRSASRLGYSDFGVNRSRVEDLRELFRQKAIIQ